MFDFGIEKVSCNDNKIGKHREYWFRFRGRKYIWRYCSDCELWLNPNELRG